MERYLELLEEKFPTATLAKTELIHLEAIQNLPKGTEQFLSDIHGEYPAFDHILRIGSGNLKEKIKDAFADQLSKDDVEQLNCFVAYPLYGVNTAWYQTIDKKQLIHCLIELLRFTSVKYSRSKVRKALPKAYHGILEDLIYTDERFPEKRAFVDSIIYELIELEEEQALIIQLAQTIQHLVIDHVHVVGDIFDRGTQADKVMDRLMRLPSVDIQWGNHDILWMGAYFGSEACLLNLLRIATRYTYLLDLEKSYGLNLRQLFSYAQQTYTENELFRPKNIAELDEEELIQMEQVHQALAILQFKAEEQLLMRRPEFNMDERKLLHAIDYEKETLHLDGKEYPIKQGCFQEIDPEHPERYTEKEREVVESLLFSFQHSQKMRQHIQFLLEKGSMYLIYNQQLLFHGCMPLNKTGEFLPLELANQSYSGKALLDFFDEQIRLSAKNLHLRSDLPTDLVWYAWSGPASPLFGKTKMATFERYFLEEKETHEEIKNWYYQLRSNVKIINRLLQEFTIDEQIGTVVNGHTPVKVRKGESPIKAEGKLFVIDGGLAKSYQKTTGIAGYSLLSNSYGYQIVTHQPFCSIPTFFEGSQAHTNVKRVIDRKLPRKSIRHTTKGERLQQQIKDIRELLEMYEARQPSETTLGRI
ncbi:MAG: fructose-bisphosphatase class III [Enterococcus sp.]